MAPKKAAARAHDPVTRGHLEAIRGALQGTPAVFCCGGTVKPSIPVRVYYGPTDKAEVLELPKDAASDGPLQALIQACDAAPFGSLKAGTNVLDSSYRSALKLETDAFVSNVNLHELGILADVKKLMVPDAHARVRAELYKLNIHRKGDFFKAHVDTPRPGGLIGSLVIALPSCHQGGALRVEHGSTVQLFDFGAALAQRPAEPLLQWAAFYSDCKHEVLEVREGVRITLTWNLYAVAMAPEEHPLKGITPSSLPLHDTLLKALQRHEFYPSGCSLAFGCEHAYAHNSLSTDFHAFPGQLKGADAALFAVCAGLGLAVRVAHISRDPNNLEEYACEDDAEIHILELSTWGFMLSAEEGGGLDEGDVRYHLRVEAGAQDRDDLVWCRKLSQHNKEAATSFLTWGNDGYTHDWMYTFAAIIVEVPDLASRLQLVHGDEG